MRRWPTKGELRRYCDVLEGQHIRSIALATGKKQHDKRETEKERDLIARKVVFYATTEGSCVLTGFI